MSVTKVDKVKIKLVLGAAFAADVTVHWGSHGSGPSTKRLAVGDTAEWDLDSLGVPEGWGFWAWIQVIGGKQESSNKDEYVYGPKTGVTAVYEVTGTTQDVKITSGIEKG